MRYEAVFRNLTLGQAQAMYRVAVNLDDDEPMHGGEGLDVERTYPRHGPWSSGARRTHDYYSTDDRRA